MAKAAADALGTIGDVRAVGPLTSLLQSSEEESAREASAQALKKLGWDPDSEEQRVRLLLATDDIEEVIKMGAAAVQPLITLLTSDSKESRAELIRIIGRIGPSAKEAVMPVCGSLLSEHESERVAAAEALALIGDASASDHISRALASQREADVVSLWFRFALAKLGHDRSEHVAAILDALSSDVGEDAVALLRRIDLCTEEQKLLFEMLARPGAAKTRERAVKAIANAQIPECSNRLWKLLAQETNEDVRKAIREAIRGSASNK